ncbi:transcriptional regulator, IclR family [Rhizobiales bacterium GAS191]|nr:transcriptional regulator, IclR family [Rhizobiales bacterium GAS191]
MPRIGGKSGEGVQAALLALRILEHLGRERREVGVTALARALETTKSRIYRHLQTLAHEGYIVQPADSERYKVGPRLVALARTVSDNVDLAVAASDALVELRDALGHSSVVSQVEPDGVRVLATVSGRAPIEIGVRPGSLLSFHASAQGKVALAFGSPEFRARALRGRLEMLTAQTIVSPAALHKEIEKIREQGWATAPNQSAIGLNTLAAPIFDASGALCGTVGVVDMVQFIEEEPSAQQIERTIAAGRRISEALGHVFK